MYALVAFQGGYSFWDTLTAAYLGKPSMFALEKQSVTIDTDPQSSNLGQFSVGSGYPVDMCTKFAAGSSADTFYQYLVDQLTSLPRA
jgi:inosine-uridine nucleoside N-ribohydrolase